MTPTQGATPSSGVDAEATGCYGSSGSSPGRARRRHIKLVAVSSEPKSSSQAQESKPAGPQLLTRSEAARLLKVSVSAIRKWQREGRLAVVKLGSSVRIPMADLQRLVDLHTVPASTAPTA